MHGTSSKVRCKSKNRYTLLLLDNIHSTFRKLFNMETVKHGYEERRLGLSWM